MTLVFGIWKIGGKKIGIQARTFMQESVNAPTVGGLVGLSSMILIGTLIFEGAAPFCSRSALSPITAGAWGSISPSSLPSPLSATRASI